MVSIEVTLTATYDGIEVPGPLTVPFTLSEVVVGRVSRLFFTMDDPADVQYGGTFSFPAPNMEVSETLTVYAMSDFAETRPYYLQLDLGDVERTTASVVDGQQLLSDLSAFPHIRQYGDSMATVNLINPCGDDGCQSDVSFTVSAPSTTLMLLQGVDRAITFDLNYTNFADDEARSVQLSISDFPQAVFQSIILSPKGLDSRFDCSSSDDGVVLCPLHQRFLVNQSNSLVLTLVVDRNGFRGNEEDFFVSLNLVVDTSNNNTDVDPSNNQIRIPFSVESRSNINVDVSFGSDRYSYTGMAGSSSLSTSSLGNLVALFVTVDNTGPSTIQNARVTINFPSRVSMDTNSLFFLYPNRIVAQAMSGSTRVATSVDCSTMGIDPSDLSDDPEFTFRLNQGRRKRSLPTATGKKAKRSFRMKRQTPNVKNLISCSTHPCVNVVCDVRQLSTDGIILAIDFNIDERFYASAGGEDYSIRADVSAFVGDVFQAMDDDPNDNTDNATVVLFEELGELDSQQLIHVIVWPTIAAVIILALFVVLLYYLGFFKRKTRKEEDEDDNVTVTKVVPHEKPESTGL